MYLNTKKKLARFTDMHIFIFRKNTLNKVKPVIKLKMSK